MKKFTFLMCAVFACLLQVNAQQFVSTDPQNRNAVIEEFTGRNCGYCPDGHVIANSIVHANPGRVWAVNVHAGGYAPTSYPNFNTGVSTTICNGFQVTGFPAGVVNRSTAQAQGRGQWQSLVNQQLSQAAECNVAGQVVVNPVTRLAKITVEVYYTANSASANNYLTIVMLQDSIWGSQSGGSSNPDQFVNGQYCHMHILRDAITADWGDEIAPTTAGTLITKEYVYEIPASIGSPNGVEVDLENILFLAYVEEKQQGSTYRPILNVNELTMTQGTEEAIYPIISNVAAASGISCSTTRTLKLDLVNGGLDELTSLKYQVKVGNAEPVEFTWEGSIASYQGSSIEIDVEIPFGTHTVEVSIVEANGTAYEFTKTGSVTTNEWAAVELEETAETEELTIEIMQDKYGNQITWELLASDMTVLASGGPYTMLVGGGSATQLHIEKATVNNGDCVKFVIRDAVGNGICCSFGEGYYQIKDSKGNVVVDGDGDFGSEASALLSIGAKNDENVEEVETVESVNIFPNPVKDVLTVKGENMKQVVIYNALGQAVETINTNDNEVRVNVSAYNNGMYFINVIDNNGEMTTSKVSVLH
ncbi:MAG: Omp28-related outer membrane protein [Bacteroidales bacterium]|nr:Omp28-related outer membrane protein [Bacteroidales bacterium]